MSKCFVFSTLTTAITFAEWGEAPANGLPKIKRKVVIKGGANLALGTPGVGLWTPRGMPTEVSAEEAAFLATNKKFAAMCANGHMMLARDKSDLETAVRDMTPKDKCAPLTESDVKKTVKVGALQAA